MKNSGAHQLRKQPLKFMRVSNELPQDQDEQLMLKEVTLPQALEMIDQGEIEDAKTIMAIYYWQGMNNRG